MCVPSLLYVISLGYSMALCISSPPGTAFGYGPANDWLALVVADVSGLPFYDYLQKYIFEYARTHLSLF